MTGLRGSMVRLVAGVVLAGAVGCETSMRTVVAIENTAISDTAATTQPMNRTVQAPENGTYQLFSSKQPRTPIYETVLKRGEEIGFRARGQVARGVAGGKIIELDDYAEGASYQWKIEEKRKE